MSDAGKRRGRPPLDARAASVPVCVRLAAKTFAAIGERAKVDRVTLSEAIRRRLARDLCNQK